MRLDLLRSATQQGFQQDSAVAQEFPRDQRRLHELTKRRAMLYVGCRKIQSRHCSTNTSLTDKARNQCTSIYDQGDVYLVAMS
jgi:hypothetical protein